MALRAEYTLGHSEFNDFLFAFIDEEQSGLKLTVLSAFARLGHDPWKESARLADLPKEAARCSLAATIAKIPNGDWSLSDAQALSIRLVKLLPVQSSVTTNSRTGEHIEYKDAKSDARKYLVWFVLAAMAAIVMSRWFGN